MSVALTAERLRELLAYDPGTGTFTWRVRSARRIKVGDAAGCDNGYGYLRIRIDGVEHKAHRLAWLYVNGLWPVSQIDHINGLRDDNRIGNLRDVSQSVNSQNLRSATAQNKSSGLLGVSWHKRDSRWVAQINIDGKKHHLGYFNTAELAYAAYLEAKREFHAGCVI